MKPYPLRVEVAVMGGGILGCSLAYHLARDHSASVALFERGAMAGGASGKAAGIVSAQCWNTWDIQVVEESRKEYRGLGMGEAEGLYQEVGGIRSASTEENVTLLKRQLHRMVEATVEGRLIGADQLAEFYPEGDFQGVLAALYAPHDAVVMPTDLTLTYARLAAEHGAYIHSGCSTLRVIWNGKNWHIDSGSEELVADALIVSCGAWTKKILSGLGHAIPLAPYVTRACLLQIYSEARIPFFHDSEKDVYLRAFPRTDILLGDGTELREVDPDRVEASDDTAFLTSVSDFLTFRFPKWAKAPVEASWWGVCASTPDRRPLVGPLPGREGLFVAAGFNGFGVMRAGALARRLSDELSSGRWGELEPCDPARFPAKPLPFEPRPGFTL